MERLKHPIKALFALILALAMIVPTIMTVPLDTSVSAAIDNMDGKSYTFPSSSPVLTATYTANPHAYSDSYTNATRCYDIALTDANGKTDATYSGTMVLALFKWSGCTAEGKASLRFVNTAITNNKSYIESYQTGSPTDISSMSSTSGSSAEYNATVTFKDAPLSVLNDLLANIYIYGNSNNLSVVTNDDFKVSEVLAFSDLTITEPSMSEVEDNTVPAGLTELLLNPQFNGTSNWVADVGSVEVINNLTTLEQYFQITAWPDQPSWAKEDGYETSGACELYGAYYATSISQKISNVIPGSKLYMSFFYRNRGIGATDQSMQLVVKAYDAGGNLLSTTSSDTINGTDAWVQHTYTYNVPDNAASLAVIYQGTGGDASSGWGNMICYPTVRTYAVSYGTVTGSGTVEVGQNVSGTTTTATLTSGDRPIPIAAEGKDTVTLTAAKGSFVSSVAGETVNAAATTVTVPADSSYVVNAVFTDWETNNAAILAKTAETVTEDDVDAIEAALKEYAYMSEESQSDETLAAEKAQLEAMLTAAEENAAANKWKEDNKDILAKTADTVTKDDLDAINAALDSYDELDEAAQAELTAEKALLDSMLTAAETDKAAEEAETSVDEAVKEAKEKVSNFVYLSDRDEENFVKSIDAAAADALKAIENADTPEEVQAALDELAKDLALIQAKADATNTIEEDALDAEDAIDATEGLTAEEKALKKSQIETAAAAAKADVGYAASTDEIDSIVDDFEDDLALIQTKVDALAQIDLDADAAKAEIDAMPNLTDEEKQAFKDEIDEAAAAAKDAVNSAATEAEVTAALDEFNSDVALIEDKAAAKDSINEKAEAAKAEIDAMPNLTDEEKQAAKDEIDEAATAAKDDVDAATNEADVTAAEDQFDDAIDLINDKAAAKDSINEKAEASKEVIDSLEYLTDEQKDDLKAMVDDAAEAGKDAVNDATKEEDIGDALNDFADALRLINAKASGLDEIAGEVLATKARLAQLKNVTVDEKNAILEEINNMVELESQAVLDATTSEEIDGIVDAVKSDLEYIEYRADYYDAINQNTDTWKENFDGYTLTDEEKEALGAEIDEAVKTAKDTIYKWTGGSEAYSKDKANEAYTEYLNAIDLIVARAQALETANKTSEETAQLIEGLGSLSDEAKDSLQNEVDKAVEAAKEAINAATTEEEIKAALEELADALKYIEDSAIASNHVAEFYTGEDGMIYTEIDSTNIDKILAGEEAYNALTEDQQAMVDQMIAEATNGMYSTYAKYLAAAKNAVAASAESFIATYLTGTDGAIYTAATADNYAQILSGLDDWNSLTQSEKDAINTKLVANGGVTYEELLAKAQETKAEIDAANAKTGDSAPLAPFAAALALSALVGVAFISKKRRFEK